MYEIVWKIECAGLPTAERHCKKCGAWRAFECSGCFRVNAQKRMLDVWLIYKCPECDDTWNMTVLSRVAPQSHISRKSIPLRSVILPSQSLQPLCARRGQLFISISGILPYAFTQIAVFERIASICADDSSYESVSAKALSSNGDAAEYEL